MGDDAALAAALELSRAAGFLGAAPIADQIAHSRAFSALLPRDARGADLGAGGGLPGLVILVDRPDVELRLVESSRRRADHLVRLVDRLGVGDRAVLDPRPAEDVGRDPECRGQFDVVVARGFARPAAVAECAAPLLRPGGLLFVADPPDPEPARWAGLSAVDLPLELRAVHAAAGAHIAELGLFDVCPDRYPRRAGVPARRPLF